MIMVRAIGSNRTNNYYKQVCRGSYKRLEKHKDEYIQKYYVALHGSEPIQILLKPFFHGKGDTCNTKDAISELKAE